MDTNMKCCLVFPICLMNAVWHWKQTTKTNRKTNWIKHCCLFWGHLFWAPHIYTICSYFHKGFNYTNIDLVKFSGHQTYLRRQLITALFASIKLALHLLVAIFTRCAPPSDIIIERTDTMMLSNFYVHKALVPSISYCPEQTIKRYHTLVCDRCYFIRTLFLVRVQGGPDAVQP